jgi:dinuclear metal center YbgI/SA1388 family protein
MPGRFVLQENGRGARIRTGDLADPNGARYQAAPRPDAPGSITYPAGRYGRGMATPLAEILAEADRMLEPDRFEDYGPNGLQVAGATEVQKIATGVSAHAELFELAAEEHAELLLVHHGLFWGPGFRTVDEMLKHRLQILFAAGIALAAYHLPLDAHPELGNNALLGRALGAERLEPFGSHRGATIGFLARMPGGGMQAPELFARITELTAREPLVQGAGPDVIRTLAIVSGSGSDYIAAAAAGGAQALLTGEPSERAMASARELGMHLIAAGHYATETFGIRRLGKHLAERFGLEHVFLDVPNPV